MRSPNFGMMKRSSAIQLKGSRISGTSSKDLDALLRRINNLGSFRFRESRTARVSAAVLLGPIERNDQQFSPDRLSYTVPLARTLASGSAFKICKIASTTVLVLPVPGGPCIR